MDENVVVTDEDVDEVNKSALNRSAAIARIGGTALVVVGIIGFLSWLWLVAKQQLDADDMSFGGFAGSPGEGPDLGDRLTLFSSFSVLLVGAATSAGIGLLLRMFADWGQIQAGGSITGLRAGEAVPWTVVDIDQDDAAL